MARRSPARGFKHDSRKSPSPFAKIDDVNSLKFEGYRPATVQELIEKKKIPGDPRSLATLSKDQPSQHLPDIHRNAPLLQVPRASPSPVHVNVSSLPRPASIAENPMDTVNMLEQLDGPSRELPGGARPSQERPSTGQEMNQMLGPGFTNYGIPRLTDSEGHPIESSSEHRFGAPSRKGGPDQLASFGITRKHEATKNSGTPFGHTFGNTSRSASPPRSRSPRSKMRSPPRLRQAIHGTPFTGSRPDQPYFPFLLANLSVPRMTKERESIIKDQLKDYAMLAVAWQRSRAGTTGSGKTSAALNAEHKYLLNSKKAMRRELARLHLGDYAQEPYRRTHVVDPSDAGLVFFKMATAYDELQDVKNALRCAKLYLNVCRQMGDSIGEALACNNIGVQYQTLGGRKNLSKAVSYHSLHLQNGDDLGRFIAYLNLGHAYREMQMVAQSRESTMKALECAQKAYSAFGESIACAQLGETLRNVGDQDASRNFLEKWLELSEGMHDERSEEQAWRSLGSLLQSSSSHQDAAECYTNAYELALSRCDNPKTDFARAMVGVSTGDQQLEQELRRAAKSLLPAPVSPL